MNTDLIEIAFHGRGGQGGVTASNLLVTAAFKTCNYPHVMAVPLFGAERRGAPVSAFARISRLELHTRSRIYTPDIIIIMDDGILRSTNPIATLKPDGMVLVNTADSVEEFRKKHDVPSSIKICVVDLVKICLGIGLVVEGTTPIVNTAILGAFSKMFPEIPLDIMKDTIAEHFNNSPKAALNIKGAEMAHENLVMG